MYDYINHSELNAIYNCSDFGLWLIQPAITIQQASATGLNCIIPNTDAFTHFKELYRNIYKFKNKDHESFKTCFTGLLSKYNYDKDLRFEDATNFVKRNNIKYILENYYKIS